MNNIMLILEYLLNRTEEGDSITNLGDREIQTSSLNNLPTNYVFINEDEEEEKDILHDAIKHIVDTYLPIEKKHWEESKCPKEHLYIDLLILKELI